MTFLAFVSREMRRSMHCVVIVRHAGLLPRQASIVDFFGIAFISSIIKLDDGKFRGE
jgi:hypothetical protein